TMSLPVGSLTVILYLPPEGTDIGVPAVMAFSVTELFGKRHVISPSGSRLKMYRKPSLSEVTVTTTESPMLYMWSLWSTSAVTLKAASWLTAWAKSCRGLGSAARAGATSPRGTSSPAMTAAPPRELVSSLMVLGLLFRNKRGQKLPSHTRTVVVGEAGLDIRGGLGSGRRRLPGKRSRRRPFRERRPSWAGLSACP